MADIVSAIRATGGDHATITLWEAAIPSNLVTADERHIGEVYAEDYQEAPIVLGSGVTTNSSRYIWLRPHYDHDPTLSQIQRPMAESGNHGGPRYIGPSGSFSSNILIDVQADFTRIDGIEVTYSTGSSTSSLVGIGINMVDSNGGRISRCTVHDLDLGTSANRNYGINCEATATLSAFSFVLWCQVYDVEGTSGVSAGIRMVSASATSIFLLNCTVDGVVTTGTDSRGFDCAATATSAVIEVRNCLSMRTSGATTNADFIFTESGGGVITTDFCASDDATADDERVGSNIINITPANEVMSLTAAAEDFRPLASGQLDDGGTNTVTIFGYSPTVMQHVDATGYDLELNGSTYSIGAHQFRVYTRHRTIGATGRDHATITLWEAATDNVLTTSELIERGVMYADADFTDSVITFAGATVDATHYRILEAHEDERPAAAAVSGDHGGVRFVGPASHGVNVEMFAMDEANFKFRDLEITLTGSRSTANAAFDLIHIDAQNVILERLIIHDCDIGPSGQAQTIIEANGDIGDSEVRNCAVYDCLNPPSSTGNHAIGIRMFANVSTENGIVCNCTVDRVGSGGNGSGIVGICISGTLDFSNIASGGATTNLDFEYNQISGTITTLNCVSDDASADDNSANDGNGGTHQISVVWGNQFVSTTSAAENYQVQDTSADLFGNGADLGTGDVAKDMLYRDRDYWRETWDVGAYQLPPTENVSAIQATGGDHATVALWEAATDNVLTGTTHTIEIGEMANENFDEEVIAAGATTDWSRFRILRPQAGARHTGVRGTGARMVSASTSTSIVLDAQEDNFCVDGIEFGRSAAAVSPSGLTGLLVSQTNAGVKFSRCIGYDMDIYDVTQSGRVIRNVDFDDQTIHHCAAFANDSVSCRTFSAAPNSGSTMGTILGNNLALRGSEPFDLFSAGAGIISQNNIGALEQGSATDFTFGGSPITNRHCASGDTSADDEDATLNHVTSIPTADVCAVTTLGSEDAVMVRAGPLEHAGFNGGRDGFTFAPWHEDLFGNDHDDEMYGQWSIGVEAWAPPVGTTQDLGTASGSSRFAGSATLTSGTQLTAAGGARFAGSATLTTVVALTAAGGARFAGSVALTTVVALPGSSSASRFAGSATLIPKANLSASGASRFAGSATLTTALALPPSASSLRFAGASSLATRTALSATGSSRFGGSAVLTASGGLQLPASSGASRFAGSATLTTTVALTAAGGARFAGSVTLGTVAVLTAAGGARFAGSAMLTATGTVAALAARASSRFGGSATLTTRVDLTGAGASRFAGSAQLATALILPGAAGSLRFAGSVTLTSSQFRLVLAVSAVMRQPCGAVASLRQPEGTAASLRQPEGSGAIVSQ